MGKVFVGIVSASIAFLVLVIAVSLTGQVLQAQQDTQATSAVSIFVLNETVAANNTLANSGTPTLSLNIQNATAAVHNESGIDLTNTVHYTLTKAGLWTILPEVAGLPGDVSLNISYNYTLVKETTAFNITESGLTGTANVGDLMPTMGLIVGIIAVLALLAVLVALFGPGLLGRF